MAFELVFGKGTQPGSKPVYDRIVALKDRDDVDRLRYEIRTKAASGEKAIQRRLDRVAKFESDALKARRENRFNDAYMCLLKASDIRGAFTSNILRDLYQILSKMKRFEEAAAIAFLAKHFYGEFFGQQLVEVYRQLGYCNHQSCDAGRGCRVLDNADLNETLESILNYDDSVSSWNQLIFLLAHVNYHIKLRPEESYELLAEKGVDFVGKIESNEAWLALFDAVDLAAMELFEIHVLALFFKLLRHMGSANKANMLETMRQSWYQPLLKKISRNLVSPNTLRRFARCQSGAFDVLLHEWILYIGYIYRPIFLGDDTLDTKYPFDDFSWYCQVGAMLLFSDGSFVEDGRFGVVNVANFFLRMLSDAIDNNNRMMSAKLRQMPRKKWAKSFDLLLLVSAISFAEWRERNLVELDRQEIDLVDSATNRHLLIILLNVQFKMITKLKTTPVPKWILQHKAFFAYLAARLLFLVGNINVLSRVMGECALTSTIGCMTVLLSDHKIAQNSREISSIFDDNCHDFTNQFVMALFLLACGGMMLPVARNHLPSVMRIISIAGTASPRFLAEKVLNDNGPPIVPSLFALQFMGSFSTECLATLLRGADQQRRLQWAKTNYPFFHQTALILVDCIIGDNKISNIETHITALLTFLALIKPSVISFDTIFDASDSDHERLLRLVDRLATLITHQLLINVECSNSDVEMQAVYRRICKLAAGQVLAAVCQLDPRARCSLVKTSLPKIMALQISQQNVSDSSLHLRIRSIVDELRCQLQQ